MKKNIVLALITLMGCFVLTNVMAQEIDHTFNYQGQLLDNGSPANGNYVSVNASTLYK